MLPKVDPALGLAGQARGDDDDDCRGIRGQWVVVEQSIFIPPGSTDEPDF